MQTKTQTKSPLSANLMSLPLMKNYSESEIVTSVNQFRKGEKSIYNFFKLAAFGAIGYLTWVYVLPPVFKAIGQFLAIAATGVLCVLLIVMAPVILKGIRAFTRFIHKNLIKHDPFAELERQRDKMLENQQTFRISKGKISALKTDMESEAEKSEKDAKSMETKILTLQKNAKTLKEDLDKMVATQGAKAKTTDEYVNGQAELLKMLSDSNRISNKLNQAKDFVQKYGTRAAIMKKFGQKLVMVETSMDIKISDFDATVEMLKKDYEFSQKARAATDAAKDAMLFTKGWELEYALDVVTSTIATDIAITAGNIKDIDSLTSTYALDSDDLYTNLNLLAENIKVGKDEVPVAKEYSNPDYQFTQSDKTKSGGFEDLM